MYHLHEFLERMCDGTTVRGYRWVTFRNPLGRPPAPWCPKPWSKSTRLDVPRFQWHEDLDGARRFGRALFSVSNWDIIDERQKRMGCWT